MIAPSESVGLVGSIIVSVIVLSGFTAVSVLLFTRSIPAESKELALVMFGSLSTMATAVVSYWVGSSLGSHRKDVLLEEGRQ